MPDRSVDDREALDALLDDVLVAHVGMSLDEARQMLNALREVVRITVLCRGTDDAYAEAAPHDGRCDTGGGRRRRVRIRLDGPRNRSGGD